MKTKSLWNNGKTDTVAQRHPAQLAEGFEPLSYDVKVGRNCPVACHAVVAERKFHSHPLIFTSAWSAN